MISLFLSFVLSLLTPTSLETDAADPELGPMNQAGLTGAVWESQVPAELDFGAEANPEMKREIACLGPEIWDCGDQWTRVRRLYRVASSTGDASDAM